MHRGHVTRSVAEGASVLMSVPAPADPSSSRDEASELPTPVLPLQRTCRPKLLGGAGANRWRATLLFVSIGTVLAWSGLAAAADVEVRSGDTLTALARRHGVTVAELRSRNDVVGNLLRVGARISLPPEATCEVRPGDRLEEVARRHAVDAASLMRANELDSPIVNPGVRLVLPTAAGEEEHLVQVGDTLYDVALRYGVSVEALISINELEGEVIHPGQRLRLRGASAPTVTETEVVVQPGDTAWQIARSHDLDVAALLKRNGLNVDAVLRPGDRLRLPVHGSHISDTGAADVSEVTVRSGDTLWSIARRYRTSVAALVSANGLEEDRVVAGQRLRVLPGNELAPATLEAVPAGSPRNLGWPVKGVVTSRFGYRSLRVNGSNFHNAVDIDGVTGDVVRAAAPGTVTFSGVRGSYGNLVTVRAGSVEYRYAHNSELLVESGDRISAGQEIARVGNTGLSFGDHVHFEVRVEGRPVDPLPLMSVR